jgi:hypothetical protein
LSCLVADDLGSLTSPAKMDSRRLVLCREDLSHAFSSCEISTKLSVDQSGLRRCAKHVIKAYAVSRNVRRVINTNRKSRSYGNE